MMSQYPLGGWAVPGSTIQYEWSDQGYDLSILGPGGGVGILVAPADYEVVEILHDQPFPSGFGPNYAVVRVLNGPWAEDKAHGHTGHYYLGHDTAKVRVGQKGHRGDLIAHADQRKGWAGTRGWWLEFGEVYWDGLMWLPGPKRSDHWFVPLLHQILSVCELPYRWGDEGWPIVGMTANLHACGYYAPGWGRKYDQPVHGAVIAFKEAHKIPMPAPGSKDETQRGWVDQRTSDLLQQRADYCRKHGPEYKPAKGKAA